MGKTGYNLVNLFSNVVFQTQLDVSKQLTLELESRTSECKQLREKLELTHSEVAQYVDSAEKLNSELVSSLHASLFLFYKMVYANRI